MTTRSLLTAMLEKVSKLDLMAFGFKHVLQCAVELEGIDCDLAVHFAVNGVQDIALAGRGFQQGILEGFLHRVVAKAVSEMEHPKKRAVTSGGVLRFGLPFRPEIPEVGCHGLKLLGVIAVMKVGDNAVAGIPHAGELALDVIRGHSALSHRLAECFVVVKRVRCCRTGRSGGCLRIRADRKRGVAPVGLMGVDGSSVSEFRQSAVHRV